MKRIAILQSNYIPWIGYFDIIKSVDEFIVYDSVQYTKNDWRNRNRIKTASGIQWLSIPVHTSNSFGQSIKDVRIVDSNWTKKHWRSLESSLNKAEHFDEYRDIWFQLYEDARNMEFLHDVNLLFLKTLCRNLGVSTTINLDTSIEFSGNSPTAKLISICKASGADYYLTGPSALSYLEMDLFQESRINLEIIDYSKYRQYKQLFGRFESNLSVLDLLANEGSNAKSHLLTRTLE
jgi:hypothetical protein